MLNFLNFSRWEFYGNVLNASYIVFLATCYDYAGSTTSKDVNTSLSPVTW